MFSSPFSFNGRIRRTEYLITLIVYFTFWYMHAQIETILASSTFYIISFLFFWLPVMWIMYAQGAKRCHDMGRSGWWQLIPFYFIWMAFEDSYPGMNEHGLNPKGIGNEIFELNSHIPEPDHNTTTT